MAKKQSLTIVIVSHNTAFWLKKTLQSLDTHVRQRAVLNLKVVVVDNASTDDSVGMVKVTFPWVQIIPLSENRGFAAGNNVALAEVKTPYVMLLNSDVECTADSKLEVLVDYLETHSEVGIISPWLELVDGSLDLAAHRGEPTLRASLMYHLGLAQRFPKSRFFGGYHQLYKDLNQPHQIDACSGAAMVVRTSAMQEVGLLDERFFMYAEDLDWCRRFREAGWKIIFFPEVRIIHHKYKSGLASQVSQKASQTKQYFYDTMLQYYDKHYQNRHPGWVRKLIESYIFIKKGGT